MSEDEPDAAGQGKPDRRHAISAVEAAQRTHGVLTLEQLLDVGVNREAARCLAASGRLHRIHRGVYAVAPTALLTQAGRDLAAVRGARLRAALRVGPRLWRSDEERMAAIACVEADLPEPEIAYRVRTAAGRLEIDLSFPAWRVVLEVDGGQHALTLNAARDVDRDAALGALGWATVRVTAAAVRADPTVAPRAVAPVLSARGWRR